MGRGPPAGLGGAVLPSGVAAAGGHSQGLRGGREHRAGGSAAASEAAPGLAPPLLLPLAFRSSCRPTGHVSQRSL